MAESLQDIINRKMQERQAQKASSIRTLKPAAGKHLYRILPGWRKNDRNTFWHDFGMHFIKTVPNGKPEVAYVCLDRTYGRPCDICAAISSAKQRSTDDDQLAVLNEASASQKYLLNVLHLTSPDKAGEVQVLEVGSQVFDAILNLAGEYYDSQEKAIFDLDEGLDIQITKEGSGLSTKYTVMPSMKASSKHSADLLDKLIDLDAVVAQENQGKLQKALTTLGTISGILPPPASEAAAARVGGRIALGDLEAEDAQFGEVDGVESDALTADDLADLGEIEELLGDLDTGT